MNLTRLDLEQFRLFEHTEWSPASGINLITGANGAGKTSLVEAVYLLAHGRSFRGGVKDSPIRRGAAEFRVYAEWEIPGKGARRTGLARSANGWNAHVDGEAVSSLGELYAVARVVCFEPGSHELLAGGAEGRRRFLDWALFHVEPNFLDIWRRYHRALKQRNAALKADADDAALLPWEQSMAEAGEFLAVLRAQASARLQCYARDVSQELLPELGEVSIQCQRGWPESRALVDALLEARERDRRLGYTTAGPHRGDWAIEFSALPSRLPLSRGQEKLAALACILGQAQELAAQNRSDWPVILLDDLASELDRVHQTRVWDWLIANRPQAIVTATEPPVTLASNRIAGRFHVEQSDLLRAEVVDE